LPVEARPRILFNPDTRSANFFIPGLLVVMCQMMSTMLSATAIVKEKEMGTLEQLYMTPVRRGELILGKTAPYAILSIFEFCFLAVLMRYAFGVPIRGAFLTLLALSVPFVLTMLGAGLLISTKAETRDAAGQMAKQRGGATESLRESGTRAGPTLGMGGALRTRAAKDHRGKVIDLCAWSPFWPRAWGARVVPGHFSQTHEHPELLGRSLLDVLTSHGLARGQAMSSLRRYELNDAWNQPFETLSGGQQARVQVLLLELAGSTLLLLDEPTDNLDVVSAEALETAIASYTGTVLAVTHDRWFMDSFDRFLVFRRDGTVSEELEPVWD